MTDKQIDKWLRRRLSPTGWVLAAYYLLMNVLCGIAMLWEALRQMRSAAGLGRDWLQAMDLDAIAANAWGYIAAIVTLFLILHAWKGPRYWREEVFRKEKPMTAGVFFPMLCLCVGSQMVNSFWIGGLEFLFNQADKSLMPLLETVSGATESFSMFLYASILAPIAEELLFRGYVLRTLRPFGKKFAVFASAFLFGLFHGNLLQTPYAFLMGLLLGYVAVEYSVMWAIGVHVFNNLVLADFLSRLTKLLPAAAGELVNLVLLGGCLAASGVILIVKRREIVDYVYSEWMDRRVLKCFFTNWGVIVLTALMLGNILLMIP